MSDRDVYLQVFPMFTVLAESEEQAEQLIRDAEAAVRGVLDTVLEGDFFEEVWCVSHDGTREDSMLWMPPSERTVA